MKYRHYFVFGGYKLLDFSFKYNINTLISYARGRKTVEKIINLRNENNKKCKLFLDSGAYSVAFSEAIKEINLDDYIDFITEYNSEFEVVAQLDTIPINSEQSDEAEEKTLINAEYMAKHYKFLDKLCFVYHLTSQRLDILKELLKLSKSYNVGWLGIPPRNMSGIPAKSYNELSEIISIGKEINPNIKIHLLGVSDIDLLRLLPIQSSDSSTYMRYAGLGRALFYDKVNCKIILFSKSNRPSFHYHLLKVEQRNFIEKRLKEINMEPNDLYINENRQKNNMYNLNLMYNELDNRNEKVYLMRKLF